MIRVSANYHLGKIACDVVMLVIVDISMKPNMQIVLMWVNKLCSYVSEIDQLKHFTNANANTFEVTLAFWNFSIQEIVDNFD